MEKLKNAGGNLEEKGEKDGAAEYLSVAGPSLHFFLQTDSSE